MSGTSESADTTRALSRAALGMGVVTAGSRAVGFVRVLVIAAILGTTYLGNTFQAANSVSNVIFELVAAGALSAALVPGFVHKLARNAEHEVVRVANALLGIAVVVLGSLTVVAMVCAPAIARLLVSGAPNAEIRDQQASLTTVLLWFFLPQIVLYAAGAIAIAVLQANRRFLAGSTAPIASSVVLVASLILFRVLAGPDPGLVLSTGQQVVLGVGGTLAVVAFVGVPIVALYRRGIRFVPSFAWRGSGAGDALRSSWWAVVLHGGLGLLLGAALIAGNAVEGGVVAYQVAWTFFLAPYAILAQPIHTAILPELAVERDDPARFAASLRWALAGMARLLIPVSALLFAFAGPLMEVLAFGAADQGTDLLATALAWLAVGLFPYGALLLATRAFFALGDTRTPGIITLVAALVGAVIMLVGSAVTSGTAVVLMLGIGQSVAAVLASGALLLGLRIRLGHPVTPALLVPVAALSVPVAVALTAFAWNVDPGGRLANLLVFGLVGAGVSGTYLLLMRSWPALRLPERVAA